MWWQVHGIEYAFGAHEYPSTGIFEGEPKQCEGFTFRKSILVGWTEKSSKEVRKVMEELSKVYKGNAYNLITKNCNHFCNEACIKLTGNSIPRWVNRLARIGMSMTLYLTLLLLDSFFTLFDYFNNSNPILSPSLSMIPKFTPLLF